MRIRDVVSSALVWVLGLHVAGCENAAPVGETPDAAAVAGLDSGASLAADAADVSSPDAGSASATDGAVPDGVDGGTLAGADAAAPPGQDASLAAGADAASGTAGHTEDRGGVLHKPGATDPKTNCAACHGSDLAGGSGPSCYGCHNANDHTVSRRGTMHRTGTTSSCNPCHGPGNSGGLGPACSTCH